MTQVDEYPNTRYLSFKEKIICAKHLIQLDKEKGYRILLFTPTLKSRKLDIDLNGTEVQYQGNYLEYYNPNAINVTAPLIEYTKDERGNIKECAIKKEEIDYYITKCNQYYNTIMQKLYNETTNKFENQITSIVQKIPLTKCNYDKDWAAFCTPVDMNEVLKYPPYMVSSFTHVLGHVFANASSSDGKPDIDHTNEWENIYEQISISGQKHEQLREYTHVDQKECLVDCVAEYFAYSSDYVSFNKDDSKNIEIEVNGKEMSLYDYME